jgi:prevent-host-death family protein
LKIDFKTLTMMELRSTPGEILDRVARDGDVFVVERNGQPKACLVPVSYLLPDVSPDRLAVELGRLEEKNEPYKLTITEEKELDFTFHETAAGESVLLSVILPHGYPDSAPRLRAQPIEPDAPHRWPDGCLSIFGVTAVWSPKTHDVIHALTLARLWLRQYSKWRKSGTWPDGG